MAVADLVNIPTTPQEMAWFSFAHSDHHKRINFYIKSKYGILLPEYLLDPIDTSENSAWDDNHQTMHNNNDAILRVSGFDISSAQWGNKNTLPNWIWLHYQLHYAEAQAANVW